MASRLLFARLLKLNGTFNSVKQTPRLLAGMKYTVIGSVHVEPLHLKVYDKDAGLDAQREANKRKEDEDHLYPPELELNEESTFAGKQRQLERVERPNFKPKKWPKESVSSTSDDPDVFGNAVLDEDMPVDPGDIAEEEFISNPVGGGKKLSMKEYANLIKEHLKAKRLREAIDVLEQRMLKEDRVKPENYIYNLLISGCAKAGYTRKAFSLFTRMRQRGLKITGGTYTSLFNSCATAPSSDDGLKRANYLREVMLEKGFEPNQITYNVMIKAYGRCGDLKTAFMLADEMKERNIPVKTETFNFLLQACASDTEYGFRHCLLTWRKMLKSGIVPDHYSFNTMLRCVRDCGVGDLASMDQVLKLILAGNQATSIAAPNAENLKNASQLNLSDQPKFASKGSQSESDDSSRSAVRNAATADVSIKDSPQMNNALQLAADEQTQQTPSNSLELPNLLALKPHLGSLISISEITRPHDRFLLLGGLTGFLNQMKLYNITPGIESFTAMLEVIPPTLAAEKQLISFIRKIGLKADIDFFNILIKKRSMRSDYEGAKEVLNMIRTAKLQPDIVTYGVLALGCQTRDEARELLQRMSDNGARLNIEILGAMLRQGCINKNFDYINELLQISLDERVKPNSIFLERLHSFVNQCARAIDARHPMTKNKPFKIGHEKFCAKLRLWYEEQGIAGLKLEDAIKKVKERPYQQYKEKPVEGMEDLKNERLMKKRKVLKYIKKIKLDNLKGDSEPALDDQKTKRIE